MMEWINTSLKDFINYLSNPVIYFTGFVVGWVWLMKYYSFWTKPGVIKTFFWITIVGLGWGLFDPNFFKEATKPDNIPIWFMSYGVGFFFWLAMRRGHINDKLMAEGKPNLEKQESDKKVYTWPDLVYSELICMVAFVGFMLVWAILVKAPLEDPANAGVTPAVAKAPWYFLGLQELLVYFDPWIAGVVLPGYIVLGLIVIPYIDTNPKGNGYYTVKDRFGEIWLFGFGFVVLWISLIFLGTFMRGPGWNFFGPFEFWDTHKVLPMNNVNLSELVWIKLLGVGLPENILVREVVGFVLVALYLFALPPLIQRMKIMKGYFDSMGFIRFHIALQLVLVMASIPVKMYLRWAFNLKYIVSVPEYLFNI